MPMAENHGLSKVIKKLRKQHHYSQEQLAILAGVSLRTIQRIESGHAASLETLKSLAAVFEVGIELLQGEVSVIDKTTEEWANAPLWVRFGFWGIRDRKVALRFEIFSFTLGAIGVLVGFTQNADYFFLGAGLFVAAYFYAIQIRWVDNKGIWQ
jgi:transcriptional regulator with XRE-family HTH domain